MELWHGGAPGLKIGQDLLPPDETELEWTSFAINVDAGLQNPNYRSDRVYATTDRDLAQSFAAYWTREPRRKGGGWLYRVEFDESLLEPDSDFPSLQGISFQAPRGRIVEIVQTGVPWRKKHLDKWNEVMGEANRRDAARTKVNIEDVEGAIASAEESDSADG